MSKRNARMYQRLDRERARKEKKAEKLAKRAERREQPADPTEPRGTFGPDGFRLGVDVIVGENDPTPGDLGVPTRSDTK